MANDTLARVLALSAKNDIEDIKEKSGITKKIVSNISEVVDENTLYFIASPKPGAKDNYDEYMLLNGAPEKIGATAEIDLTEYTKTADMAAVALSGSYDDLEDTPDSVSVFLNDAGYLTEQDIEGKQDKLTPGEGITISDDNVISSAGGVSEDRVNELIDNKLNAIPNAEGGAY